MAATKPMLDIKVCRMIASPRHETAGGVATSAKTLGSGTATTGLGIVDKKDWDEAIILAGRSQVNSTAKMILRVYQQSGAGTLAASAGTAIATKSLTSGSKSGNFHVIRLTNLSQYKRYINAKLSSVGTCSYPDVWCILLKGKEIPPSHGSAVTVANV